MATKTTILVLGEPKPREIWITRTIAIRVFCDCYKHSHRREYWVFLVALDRDEVKAYIKRGDSDDSAPWRQSDIWGPIELEVCAARLEFGLSPDATDTGSLPGPGGEPNMGPGGEPNQVVESTTDNLPWYGERPHAQLKYQVKVDERETAFEQAAREGLADHYDADAPKESATKRKRAAKRAAAYAQPSFVGEDFEPPTEAVHGGDGTEKS